jgi:hypothetical protein
MASSTHEPASPALHPERALLTPIWIAALVVLIVNDHLLKGSGLLPHVVTGKLSDFAGLIVAPVLLASVLQVRDRSRLLACHVAVGIVFAGIQLWVPFADRWSVLMGLVGHPWTITSDPTDLIALPMLAVAWVLLLPAMQRPMLAGLRQTAIASLGTVGLWATVATSDDGGDGNWDDWGETEGGFESVDGRVVIHNANDHDMAIYVRPLRTEVRIDCSAIAKDPARMLPEHAFGDAVHWVLPARTNLAVDEIGGVGCGAAWVGGEGIPSQLLFWNEFEYPLQTFPGQYEALVDMPASGAAVIFDGSGPAIWQGGEGFRFTPPQTLPELPASCESSGSGRIEVDAALPLAYPVELLGREYGPDGCFELELLELFDQAATRIAYLCIPEAALPFAVGERIRFDGLDWGGAFAVTVSLLDPALLDIALDEQGRPVRETTLIRDADSLVALEGRLGHELQAHPRIACPWRVDEDCARTEQAFDIRLGETGQVLVAGDELVMFEEPGYERGFALVHGQTRVVVDEACDPWGTQPGVVLDVVLTAGVPIP